MDQPSASSARAKNVSFAAEQGLTGPVLATLYVVAGLIPLGLAAWASPGTGSFWFELGAACAILAMSLLVLQFLSSGRYEFLSGRIGIDRTMGFHRIAAYGVVVLAILHPLAYTGTNVLVDATAAWAQLQGMAGSPRFRSGVVALALLLFLVGFATIRTKPCVRYEIWRASHSLVALLAVSLTLHHALTAGIYSRLEPLRSVWFLYGLLATSAAIIVYFIRPWRMWREDWRVESAHLVAEGVTQVILRGPDDTRLCFRGGQFIWATVAPHHPPFHDHPFSIASSAGLLPRLKLLVRHAGDCTNTFDRIVPGTGVAIDGPHGSFVLPSGTDPVLMVAGGVGIAPLLGILSEAADKNDARSFRLLYAARHRNSMAGLEELQALQRRLDLSVTYCLDRPCGEVTALQGPICPKHLVDLLAGLKSEHVTVMLCGPSAMMEFAADALIALGLQPNKIHYERFDFGAGRGQIDRRRRRLAIGILTAFPLSALLFSFR